MAPRTASSRSLKGRTQAMADQRGATGVEDFEREASNR
jgi:hypothetical protein